MSESIEPLSPASAVDRTYLPPLRIHHLLACIAVAAVVLTVVQMRTPAEALQVMTAWQMARTAIGVSILAAGLTLCAFSIYWQVKGYRAISEPGEWLLLSYSFWLISFLTNWVIVPLVWSMQANPWSKSILLWDLSDWTTMIAHILLTAVKWGLPAVFFVIGVRRIADTWPWRVCFSLIAIGYAYEFLGQLLAGFNFFPNVGLPRRTVALLMASTGGFVLVALFAAIFNDKMRIAGERGPTGPASHCTWRNA